MSRMIDLTRACEDLIAGTLTTEAFCVKVCEIVKINDPRLLETLRERVNGVLQYPPEMRDHPEFLVVRVSTMVVDWRKEHGGLSPRSFEQHLRELFGVDPAGLDDNGSPSSV
jgi:hypothetical protein